MELKEAIKKLSELIKHKNDYDYAYGAKIYRPYSMSKEDWGCVEVVLAELDTRYNKGYQDGFKQAKFDCEMDKLDGR